MKTPLPPADPSGIDLDAADLKALLADGRERRIAKGDPLWSEGDQPDTLWHVREGKANMVVNGAEGREHIVSYCSKAQTFCLSAAISGKPMPCAAVAATDMVLVAVPRSRFEAIFRRLPAFARRVMEQLAQSTCESHMSSARAGEPVKARLASMLGRLHRQYEGRPLPFTRLELANMTGTTVESAIRAMSGWEKSGAIHSVRGRIEIRRPQEFAEAAA
jgi:CRP-like cAMP-binding protein